MSNIIKRGNAQSVEDFFKEELETTGKEYNFDFKNAIPIIKEAIDRGEHITIIGDYDCDGISATAILNMALKALGADVSYILPLRFTEGYGMKPSMVDNIEDGLVITVDNGIAARDAIQKAVDKGLTVIVTDHHLPVVENNEVVLPPADCIINPHVEDVQAQLKDETQSAYTYVNYCGAGISLKLAEKLLEGYNEDPDLIKKLYAFAAIATVADVMPMTGDNRNIYKKGAEAMIEGATTDGLYHLIAENGVDIHSLPEGLPAYALITDYTCGFKLGPCFNGLSRLYDDGAKKALKAVLVDGNPERARRLVKEMVDGNEKRKTIVEEEMAKIDKFIADNHMENDCPLVVYLPEAGRGIIGLDAGKLTERYVTPSIVICGEEDVCHGSCRSPEGINIKAMLDCVSDNLIAYGGHEGAAGLTIMRDAIPAFRQALLDLCRDYGIHSMLTDDVYYDLVIDASEAPGCIEYIYDKLAPFGPGNPEPVFMIDNFTITDLKLMGADKQHVKLTGPNGLTAVAFNIAAGGLPEQLEVGRTISVMGTLSYNIFRQQAYPQISVQLFCDGQHREITFPEQEHITTIEENEER